MNSNYSQLSRIADLNNLRVAWKKIYSKDSRGGADQQTVQDFAKNLQDELKKLRDELIDGSYTPKPLTVIDMPKQGKPKEKREICFPAVRDKVAQEAVKIIIEPDLNKQFSDKSYGYRPNKGPVKAVRRVIHYLGNLQKKWVVLLDIDDFFPSIIHQKLTDILESFSIDLPIIKYLMFWLKMGTINKHGKWHDVFQGLSQGGIVSPLLANVYLNELDKELSDRRIEFVRYADDLRLFAQSREEAEKSFAVCQDFLNNQLELKLNPIPEAVFSVQTGFSFLGMHFKENKVSIDPMKWLDFENKIRKKLKNKHKNWQQCLQALSDSARGWTNYYGQVVPNEQLIEISKIMEKECIQILAQSLADNRNQKQKFKEGANWLYFPGLDSEQERQEVVIRIINKATEKSKDLKAKQKTTQDVQKVVRREKKRHSKQILNVAHLTVTTPGMFLGLAQGRVQARKDRRIIFEVPFQKIESIAVLQKSVSLSSDCITSCAKKGVPIFWITGFNQVVAYVHNPDSERADIQVSQLNCTQNFQLRFSICKQIVIGKIKNQINLIKYFSKYERKKVTAFQSHYDDFIAKSEKIIKEAKGQRYSEPWEKCSDNLFGLEGRMGAEYWTIIAKMLPQDFDFPGRIGQGAQDLVNSLLNYGYAILRSQVLLELYRSGLNPNISFLHIPRKGKATLSFDLMEIFRPQAVDRVVLSELRRSAKAFSLNKKGQLTDASRNQLIKKIRLRFATIEKFRKQELKFEEILRKQANDLKKQILSKGKFRPYIAKW